MKLFYRLDGHEVVRCDSILEYAIWRSGHEDCHVRLTEIGLLRVSTVFLGLDHSFGDSPPVLFETMIFGDGAHAYVDRCCTWEQAELMHERAVALAVARIRQVDTAIGAVIANKKAVP